MANGVTVTVKVTEDRWKEVEDRLREALAGVVSHTAQVIRDHAVAVVPVRTGRLRDSIDIQQEDDLNATVEATEDYAGFVELGTVRMAARPYLTPAAELARVGFQPAIEAAIRESTT